jgi:hypothetical protein
VTTAGADVVRGAVKDIVETLDRSIIAAYQTFLEQVGGTGDISFPLVVGLLGKEVHREAEVTAALAVPGS